MKRCPECRKDYIDDSLIYCLDDGVALVQGTVADEPATAVLSVDKDLTKQLKADGTRSTSITPRLPAFLSGKTLALIVIVMLALVAAVFAYGYFKRPSTGGGKAVRVTFETPPELSSVWAAISPDGQKIAFSADDAEGNRRLYIRELDSTEAKLLNGSDNPIEPFWAPDSRSVAYGSNGKLKRSDLASGGNARVLCDAARLVGGSWSKDGNIVFTPDYGYRLWQVLAEGGEPKSVESGEADDGVEFRYPYFLPDGRHFLFLRGARKGIGVGSLDSPDIKAIAPDVSGAVYAPEGYLIFVRDEVLVAQPFDTNKLELSGEPLPITAWKGSANSRRFSVSQTGTLLWQRPWQPAYHLAWFDRQGTQVGAIETPGELLVGQEPHISPDGKRLAVRRESNIWVIDLDKGAPQRITTTFAQSPVWSPDGARLLYNGGNGLWVRNANGSGDAENVWPGTNYPRDWTPDGRFMIFTRRGVKTRLDLYALPLFGERKEYLLLGSAFDEENAQISPDGHWLAYASDESGDPEIYVQSFSADGQLGADKKRISTSGGRMPVWRRDGTELYFIARDRGLMVAQVKTGGAEFQFTTPKPLFKTQIVDRLPDIILHHEYDVSPDGQRFLIDTAAGDTKAPNAALILNWPELLKK